MGIFDEIASEIASGIQSIASPPAQAAEDFSRPLPASTVEEIGTAVANVSQNFGNAVIVSEVGSTKLLSVAFPEPKQLTGYVELVNPTQLSGPFNSVPLVVISYGSRYAKHKRVVDFGAPGVSFSVIAETLEVSIYQREKNTINVAASYGIGLVNYDSVAAPTYTLASQKIGNLGFVSLIPDTSPETDPAIAAQDSGASYPVGCVTLQCVLKTKPNVPFRISLQSFGGGAAEFNIPAGSLVGPVIPLNGRIAQIFLLNDDAFIQQVNCVFRVRI